MPFILYGKQDKLFFRKYPSNLSTVMKFTTILPWNLQYKLPLHETSNNPFGTNSLTHGKVLFCCVILACK